MAEISTITGRIKHLGVGDHMTRPDVLTHYSTVLFEDENGREICLERVIIPDYLSAFFNQNPQGKFHILSINYPQIFGSRAVHHLFGLTTNKSTHNGIVPIQRFVNSAKLTTILQNGLLGLITLPFMGAGLIFWLWALRTFMVGLPTSEMTAILSKT